MNLSKKVFGSNVDGNIRTYLNNMQRGTFEIQPSDSLQSEFSSDQTYLGDRTPYARMWVAINTTELDKDKNEVDSKNTIYTINTNEENTYDSSPNKPVGNQLRDNPYLKPASGITSINSKSEGSVGALRRTTVNFIVHNKEDFETIFLPFFLKPGATVFVDFGWSDKNLSLYNPKDLITNKNLSMNGFYTDIFKDDKQIGEGFKTTLSGQVTKYDVNVDDKGSFVCNLEFVSSNYALLDKTVDDDNNLKFMFNNAIEELIMGYFLNFSGVPRNRIDGIFNLKEINKLDYQERKKLTNDFFDANTKPGATALIGNVSKKSGVYYQNLSGGNNEEDKLDQKEALYISFGLFEDKFLNNFISFWQIKDDDGKVVNRTEDAPYENTFSNANSYARYDENLYTLQSLPFQDADERTSYLYPDVWDDTYNKNKPTTWDSTKNDKIKRRIPLRDLFIAVPTISEAFSKSTNVNDALESIFDEIKSDSGGIINIKMVANNDAQASIAFHDVNVTNEDGDEMLEFDLTSGNTIVLNSDLKFETPKAGLSSMIAIGNLKQPTIFGEDELDKFNLINSISGGKRKFKVRHFPIYGDVPATQKALSLNLSKVLDSKKVDGVTNSFYGASAGITPSQQFDEYIKSRQSVINKLDDPENNGVDDTTPPKIENDDDLPTETDDGKQIVYAKSRRDSELLKAKIANFVNTSDNGISPVMPISLTLKVYGNNFLGIGDYFSVNFLPKHYKERVYFQIVGVDHSIGTSMWDTTYTTVMRLRSTEKYYQFGDLPSDDVQVEVRFHPTLQKQIISEIQENIGDGYMENLAVKHLVTNLKDAGTTNLTLESNSKASRADAEALGETYDDIPDITISKTTFDLDPNQSQEEIEKLKKDQSSFFDGNTNVFTDRIGFQVKRPPNLTRGELAYYQSISNLLLGDDVINWELANSEGNGFSFYLRKSNPIKSNALKLKNVKPGEIYVIPRLNEDNRYNNLDRFDYTDNKGLKIPLVGEEYGSYILSALDSSGGDTFGLSDLQVDIDNIIKNKKQNISPNIAVSKEFLKTGTKKITNPYFFDTIVWKIENSFGPGISLTNFTNFNITGHKDFNILPNILIPTKYIKMELDKFVYLLWKKFASTKKGFDAVFAEHNK
jgi:citrate lyase gamma subunit